MFSFFSLCSHWLFDKTVSTINLSYSNFWSTANLFPKKSVFWRLTSHLQYLLHDIWPELVTSNTVTSRPFGHWQKKNGGIKNKSGKIENNIDNRNIKNVVGNCFKFLFWCYHLNVSRFNVWCYRLFPYILVKWLKNISQKQNSNTKSIKKIFFHLSIKIYC